MGIIDKCTRSLRFQVGETAESFHNNAHCTATSMNSASQKENLELGLYYYNARYYADSLIPSSQTFNRYSYVGNRPLNHTDPFRHCAGIPGNGVDEDC